MVVVKFRWWSENQGQQRQDSKQDGQLLYLLFSRALPQLPAIWRHCLSLCFSSFIIREDDDNDDELDTD